MPKQLLSLSNDLIFKAIFGTEEEILLDLLNSFPCFANEKQIESLQILNPEISKNTNLDKSILDILAKDKNGNKFLIEMQSRTDKKFKKRILFYWSNVYSKSIRSGNSFKELPKVNSFNFISDKLFSEDSKYYHIFKLKDEENKIHLTEDLEIHTIELGKFNKSIEQIETDLDVWLLLIQQSKTLKETEMKTLTKKNPKAKKAIKKLKIVSYNPKNEYHVIAKRMAAFDEANRKEDLKDLKEKIRKEVKLEVIEEGKLDTALKLLERGFSIEEVSSIIELRPEQILNYKKKSKK